MSDRRLASRTRRPAHFDILRFLVGYSAVWRTRLRASCTPSHRDASRAVKRARDTGSSAALSRDAADRESGGARSALHTNPSDARVSGRLRRNPVRVAQPPARVRRVDTGGLCGGPRRGLRARRRRGGGDPVAFSGRAPRRRARASGHTVSRSSTLPVGSSGLAPAPAVPTSTFCGFLLDILRLFCGSETRVLSLNLDRRHHRRADP